VARKKSAQQLDAERITAVGEALGALERRIRKRKASPTALMTAAVRTGAAELVVLTELHDPSGLHVAMAESEVTLAKESATHAVALLGWHHLLDWSHLHQELPPIPAQDYVEAVKGSAWLGTAFRDLEECLNDRPADTGDGDVFEGYPGVLYRRVYDTIFGHDPFADPDRLGGLTAGVRSMTTLHERSERYFRGLATGEILYDSSGPGGLYTFLNVWAAQNDT
jgi:hypothetical protein